MGDLSEMITDKEEVEEEVEELKVAGSKVQGLYRCPKCDVLHRVSEIGFFKCHPAQIEAFERRKNLVKNDS